MARPRLRARWIVLAAVVAVAGLLAWRVTAIMAPAGRHHGGRFAYDMSRLEVDVVRASRQSVPVVIRAAGSVQTHHSVAIQAQVGGTLQKVLFNEGDQVKAGQLLFVIDPQPYAIQVAQAEGKVEQDKAKLASDQANAQRDARLVKQGYVSTQDNENAAALVLQDKGTLATDQASLAQAKLQLGYTRIHAPISGRTGALAYKAGNLIQANNATPLVTINQISPILVQFDIPQSQIGDLQRYLHDPAMDIYIRSSNGSLVASGGKLVFIDNTVNQDSGTLTLKAQFNNKKHELWPGELVHVTMRLTVQHNALVVPDTAVQPGQQGDYVYVVDNGKVAVKNVRVERQYQNYAIISQGLRAGDKVVVHIPRELHGGLAVRANILPAINVASAASSETPATAPTPSASS